MTPHRSRCAWAGDDPLYQAYHDTEWGVPLHNERALFELLCLEGAQAGLSWITILRKREAYRAAFDAFDVHRIARYDPRTIDALMHNPGIVRNRAKIDATIANARATLALYEAGTSLDALLWGFVDGVPVRNRWRPGEVPAASPASHAMSRALKQRGFKFVGPTICYALMQATGMVDDHTVGCFRHATD